jgi:hypothetical protein
MTYKADYQLGKEDKKPTLDSDKVVAIDEGTLGKFVKTWEIFDPEGRSDRNQPAIEVKTEAGSKLMIALPATKSAHPRSKMGQWIKKYGKPPYVGQEVTSTPNADGFYRIVL